MSPRHSNIIMFGIVTGLVLAGLLVWLGHKFLAADTFASIVALCDVLGKFFLLALRMIIVPLVLASVVMGIASMGDIRRIGRVGLKTLSYYLLTSFLAVALGILIVTLAQPGEGMGVMLGQQTTADTERLESIRAKQDLGFGDIILSFLSPNIVQALATGDMMPIIIFALVLGGILTTLGERGNALISVFDGLNEAMMKFIGLVMWIAPVGIFGIVTAKFGQAVMADAGEAATRGVFRYSTVVLTGLAIHGAIVLPLLCWTLGRRNPLVFAGHMVPAILTAWSISSSSATLPVTIECAEKRAGLDAKAAGFVLPIGATVNMDGTALYEAVAVIFIAQAYGVDLDFMKLFVIFLTATLASIGAAGVPQAGLVTMVIVLTAVGLPVDGIGLILAVDWFIDRFRTVVNIWGDSVGATWIDRMVRA